MARFDPNRYPDRLAFEANARRIRSEELGRIFAAAAAWAGGCTQRLARRVMPGSVVTASRRPHAAHGGSAS